MKPPSFTLLFTAVLRDRGVSAGDRDETDLKRESDNRAQVQSQFTTVGENSILCNRALPLAFASTCAKLHEDCTRSIPPLRRERRFALQSSLMDPGVAVNREPAHSRIRTSHTRLSCISLSLLVETVRAFGQLWAP
jgi:hypothetical protein